MNTRLIFSLVVIVVLLTSVGGATAHPGVNAPAAPQAAVATGFTFQGQLKNAGAPVNGNCDMTFKLYDAANISTQIGSAITATVPVSNSLFTVMLNTNGEYGANAFNGYARWLEVSVKCAGDAAFTTLTPRQQITAAPYAQYSLTSNSAPRTPYVPLYRPQTLDLAAIDPDLKGFYGGFTDGRYGYFVPNNFEVSGKVARLDLHNFTPSGVTTLDLAAVDPDLHGFISGFTDGRYAYFVPFVNYSFTHFGKVARVDLQNFVTSTVTVLNLAAVDAQLVGFCGGFTDGRYGYLAHCANNPQVGKIPRIDLQNFTTAGVTVLNLSTVDPDIDGVGNGFTDGRYAYFPNDKKLARVDLNNFTPTGVTVLDLRLVDPNFGGFNSSFSDGRYGYLLPFNGSVTDGKFVRVDLQNFTISGVTVLDLTTVNVGLQSFMGGFTDGHFAYLAPWVIYPGTIPHGRLVRVDLQNFTASGVTFQDLSTYDPDLKGFTGAFTDGTFAYLVPGYNGAEYGKVVRIQLASGIGSP